MPEDDVALNLCEHIARGGSASCAAVGFGQVGRESCVRTKRPELRVIHLVYETVGYDVMTPFGTSRACDDRQSGTRAFGDGIHRALGHEVVAHECLE